MRFEVKFSHENPSIGIFLIDEDEDHEKLVLQFSILGELTYDRKNDIATAAMKFVSLCVNPDKNMPTLKIHD